MTEPQIAVGILSGKEIEFTIQNKPIPFQRCIRNNLKYMVMNLPWDAEIVLSI